MPSGVGHAFQFWEVPFSVEEVVRQASSGVTHLIWLVLFPDPAWKLVELVHLTKVGKKGLQEQSLGTEDI